MDKREYDRFLIKAILCIGFDRESDHSKSMSNNKMPNSRTKIQY